MFKINIPKEITVKNSIYRRYSFEHKLFFLTVFFQVVSVVISKSEDSTTAIVSNKGSDDKIEEWIDSFQHDKKDTITEVLNKRKTNFRYSYLTYLKLLSELNDRTELSEENDDEAESEEIIFPPSHSLTQTDREYFNIVRTEDGQSSFTRERDIGGRH